LFPDSLFNLSETRVFIARGLRARRHFTTVQRRLILNRYSIGIYCIVSNIKLQGIKDKVFPFSATQSTPFEQFAPPPLNFFDISHRPLINANIVPWLSAP
jgi:hypothetical protein